MRTIFLLLSFLTLTAKADLKILILDTGIDLRNKTLTKYVPKEYLIEENRDTHGHGTTIASIIIKHACPGIVIIPFKYYNGDHFLNELKGLRKAIELKVDVINFSGGGDGARGEEEVLVKKFIAGGGRLIAAAGNDNQSADLFFPGGYKLKGITTVGSLDKFGHKTITSNFGKYLVWRLGQDVPGTGLNNTPTTMSGTSSATALYTSQLVEDWCSKQGH